MRKQKSPPEKGTQDGALSSTNQTSVECTAEEKLVWDALEEALALELPTRVFGALCAGDSSVDRTFRLVGASRYRRSRAVGSYFWPRGG